MDLEVPHEFWDQVGAQTLGRKTNIVDLVERGGPNIRKGNIATLVEHGGHPMENYDPRVEYALIGAKLVKESGAGPTWASWGFFDK